MAAVAAATALATRGHGPHDGHPLSAPGYGANAAALAARHDPIAVADDGSGELTLTDDEAGAGGVVDTTASPSGHYLCSRRSPER